MADTRPSAPATGDPVTVAGAAGGSAAAASCTQSAPCSNPAISPTRVPAGKRTEPVGRIVPPSGGVVSGFSVTSSGASV